MTTSRCDATAPAVFHLACHADTPSRGVDGVIVEMASTDADSRLCYRIDGADSVAFPVRQTPLRADELWKTTCFELFLKPDDGQEYAEFNFSPSGQWAAYRFGGRRTGMRESPVTLMPRIEMNNGQPDAWDVVIQRHDLPATACSMGIAAVIEERDGTKSYWALAHAPGPPDFHHPDCFAAALPAPERP